MTGFSDNWNVMTSVSDKAWVEIGNNISSKVVKLKKEDGTENEFVISLRSTDKKGLKELQDKVDDLAKESPDHSTFFKNFDEASKKELKGNCEIVQKRLFKGMPSFVPLPPKPSTPPPSPRGKELPARQPVMSNPMQITLTLADGKTEKFFISLNVRSKAELEYDLKHIADGFMGKNKAEFITHVREKLREKNVIFADSAEEIRELFQDKPPPLPPGKKEAQARMEKEEGRIAERLGKLATKDFQKNKQITGALESAIDGLNQGARKKTVIDALVKNGYDKTQAKEIYNLAKSEIASTKEGDVKHEVSEWGVSDTILESMPQKARASMASPTIVEKRGSVAKPPSPPSRKPPSPTDKKKDSIGGKS